MAGCHDIVRLRPRVETASNHQILLVEDHADTAAGMARLLTKAGYQVTIAPSAEAALAVAHRGFAVVVSDIGLPEMDGFELMRQLKEKFGLKGIALSGYDAKEDVARAHAAGFSELLLKPIGIAAVRAAIERQMQAG
jgi:CheY-like chemotaxis protein